MDLTRWTAPGRAVLRLAVRLSRARRGTTFLIIALIAVPLAAATASLAVLHSLNPTRAEQVRMQFGAADLRTYGTLGPAAEALPPGSRVGSLSRTNQPVRFGQRSANVPVVATGGDHDLVRSRAALAAGRWPGGAGEAAVTTAVAAAQSAGVGQTITIGDRAYRVVGVYRALRNRTAQEVQIPRPAQWAPVSETLVGLPPAHDDPDGVAAALRDRVGPVLTHADVDPGEASARTPATLTQWAVIMIEVTLLIGAVFAVVRGRESRYARALVEVGASRRQITALSAARALVLAAVGAVLGTAVGLGVAELARRGLADAVPFVAPSVRASAGELALLVGFVLVLTLVAALAALRPAGARSGPARPGMWRSAGPAAAITALGAAALFWAVNLGGGNSRAVLLCAGAALAVTGVALLGTEALFLLGNVRGGPPSFRIGVRDLARHRARTRAMMVAGLAGLVGGTVALLALASLAVRDERAYQPQLRADQLVVDGVAADPARELADRLGGAALAPLRAAYRATPSGEPALVLAARPDGSQAVLTVAEPAELSAFGVSPGAVVDGGADQAFVLIAGTASGGAVRLGGGGWRDTLSAASAGPPLQRDSPLPAVVITRMAAERLGITTPTTPTGWVLSTGKPLTGADRAAIAEFTARHQGAAAVVEQGWVDTDAAFRKWLNVGVVGFGVLACLMVIVLAEVERARTYAVLHGLGCSPWLRRRIAAVSAGLLSAWFVVLATAVSIPLARIALDRTPLVVEWPTLLLNGVVMVAAAAVVVSMRARGRVSLTEGSL
jgi:hypothetical protein